MVLEQARVGVGTITETQLWSEKRGIVEASSRALGVGPVEGRGY